MHFHALKLFVACAAIAAGSFPALAADPILVPVLTPLTGAIADLGQDTKKSVAIAVEQINAAGGINGRPLVVELVDTQGRPDIARRETERVMNTKKGAVVLGCDGSAGTSVAAQVAEQAGVVYMNSGAVSEEFFQRGYTWYFSDQVTGTDEAGAAIGLVEHLFRSRNPAPRVAFLYEDSPRGTGTTQLLKDMAAKKGIPVAATLSYNRAERNMLPLITKLRESGATVVVWTNYLEDTVAGLSAMRDLGYFPYVIGVGNGAGHARLPTLISPEVMQKVRLSVVDYFNTDLPRASAFVAAYSKRYGVPPSGYASLCYRGIHTLKEALTIASRGGAAVTPASVKAALMTLDIPGDKTIAPYRFIKFDKTGRNLGTQSIVQQWRDNGTKKVTIWPLDVANSKPDALP
ncbi:MAG: ABC transporter substrate-binding protein [Devosia sp.]|nr:ABC transporter substrate-binding protein [Devosia sp.]